MSWGTEHCASVPLQTVTMGGLDLHRTEAMALPFVQMLRPPVCSCVCQVITYIVASKQRGKRKGERDRRREREQGRRPRNRRSFCFLHHPHLPSNWDFFYF